LDVKAWVLLCAWAPLACQCPSISRKTQEEQGSAEEQVRPVYPALEGAPEPLAAVLCDALHRLPESRRAECCSRLPGTVFADECVRALSAALTAQAIALERQGVDDCAQALARAYQGCEWVGPTPVPLPPACAGLAKGRLSAGAACRSSLECQRGLFCRGSGPTSPGTCAAPGAAGALCALAVDSLGTYLRQEQPDAFHPECAGWCDRRRCADVLAPGAACTFHAQCGPAARCAEGHCVAGPQAALGAACLGTECLPGSRCVAGHCALPKAAGERCEAFVECLGGCFSRDGGPKVCGPDCAVR